MENVESVVSIAKMLQDYGPWGMVVILLGFMVWKERLSRKDQDSRNDLTIKVVEVMTDLKAVIKQQHEDSKEDRKMILDIFYKVCK